MIRPSARTGFLALIHRFEGRCAWMYLDRLGLVTTAVGNLIDPIAPALYLPWQRADGSAASLDEIKAEWMRIKALQAMAPRGGGAFAAVATLRLTDEAIDALVEARMVEMWRTLEHRFDGLGGWPSDAQLAILGMAWAAGPVFVAPHFSAACRALDFTRAAAESALHTPRDNVHRQLLENAAVVVAHGFDRDRLYWPTVLSAGASDETQEVAALGPDEQPIPILPDEDEPVREST